MKNLLLLLLAIGIASIAKAQNTSQQNLNNFENFIDYFQKAATDKDSLLFMSCFSKQLSTNFFNADSSEICSRIDLMEALLNEQSFDDFAGIIGGSAKGFKALDEKGMNYVNSNNPLNQRSGEITICANQVALRRTPSLKGPCIARLDKGVYSGFARTDAFEFEDEQGIVWVPVSISVVGIGLVKGYVSKELLKIKQQNLKYTIDVSLTNKGWRITGLKLLEATPSSLPFANL